MPSEPRAVLGRVDKADRLIAADPELEALQREAGSRIGQTLALPQVTAVAQLARKLGIPVTRPALAASTDHDIELTVRAVPQGNEVALSLEGWTVRAPTGPRLASLLGTSGDTGSAASRNEWSADEELRVIALSADLAEHLGVDPAESAGVPLTRVVRLDEDQAGEMPLISALASRRSFTGQLARSRADDNRTIVLSGDVVTAADGSFAGFRGTARAEQSGPQTHEEPATAAFDHVLDEVLRFPLDRIIDSAERIVERADGPLRNEYATYGSDIAAAARHLLSVVRSMSEDSAQSQRVIDLAALVAEAVVMLESSAEDRKVALNVQASEPLPATGQERAVIQILVNLIGNAVRHSPLDGGVKIAFARTDGTASVTISDQGPGIDPGDQQRIFEKFERADARQGGTGLGLAISRRLARSMGGDVTLESAPGAGAHFTLTLPSP